MSSRTTLFAIGWLGLILAGCTSPAAMPPDQRATAVTESDLPKGETAWVTSDDGILALRLSAKSQQLAAGESTLEDELLRFMVEGNRFDTGGLPDDFDKSRRPRKHLVGLVRTKKGQFGLITLYRELAVVELDGKVGVAPAKVDNSRTLPATGNQ